MPSSQRKKSFVWKHFRVSKEDERKAICNFCGVERKRGTDTRNYSTSTLAAHLKRCEKYRSEMGKHTEITGKSSSSGYGGRKKEKSLVESISLKNGKRRNRDSDAGERKGSKIRSGDDSQDDVICSRQMDLVHSGTVMHSLYKQHLSGNLCDLTLISAAPSGNHAPESLLNAMPQKKFKAHSSVLSALSSKIEALIDMGSRTIEMKDVTAFGLQSLLEIVYTGRIKKNILICHEDIHQVWKAARDLDLQYALSYIEEEFPQSMRWIIEEELQNQEEKEGNIPDDEDDLIDLCAGVTSPEGIEMENPELHMDEKRNKQSVVEITFTK